MNAALALPAMNAAALADNVTAAMAVLGPVFAEAGVFARFSADNPAIPSQWSDTVELLAAEAYMSTIYKYKAADGAMTLVEKNAGPPFRARFPGQAKNWVRVQFRSEAESRNLAAALQAFFAANEQARPDWFLPGTTDDKLFVFFCAEALLLVHAVSHSDPRLPRCDPRSPLPAPRPGPRSTSLRCCKCVGACVRAFVLPRSLPTGRVETRHA